MEELAEELTEKTNLMWVILWEAVVIGLALVIFFFLSGIISGFTGFLGCLLLFGAIFVIMIFHPYHGGTLTTFSFSFWGVFFVILFAFLELVVTQSDKTWLLILISLITLVFIIFFYLYVYYVSPEIGIPRKTAAISVVLETVILLLIVLSSNYPFYK